MKFVERLPLSTWLKQRLTAHPRPEMALKDLETRISQLAKKHDLRLLESLEGGSSAFVATAVWPDGREAIVKMPLEGVDGGLDFQHEIKTLTEADGRGYVKLLVFDEELNAAILERLGKPLSAFGLSINAQIEILCRALGESWRKLENAEGFPDTFETTNWFTDFIHKTWLATGKPCSKDLVDKADGYIAERRKAHRSEACVLAHGDPHHLNLLQDRGATGRAFKFIDPDGIVIEPAYDLGVIMREWPDALLADPIEQSLERCQLLSSLTGVAEEAIWQWGLVQCVATGLLLTEINHAEGQKLLSIAETIKTLP